MKYKFLTFVFLVAFFTEANCQIEREIAAFIDSTEIKINNGRKLLVNTINDKNYKKAKDIYDYLIEINEGNKCGAFSIYEELYICCIVADWDRWANLAKQIEAYDKYMCYPNIYQIERTLYENIKENADYMLNRLTELPDEDKRMIEIFITLIKEDKANDVYAQKVKEFKKQYSDSEYNFFLKKYLPRAWKASSWAFGAGTAVVVPTSNLADYFEPNAQFYMHMDFNIEKVYTSFYLSGGSSKLTKGFTAVSSDTTLNFNPGKYFNYFEAGMEGGYFLVRNNFAHIAPYGLLGGTSIRSDIYEPKENRESDEIEIFNSFTAGLGLHTEFKILQWDSRHYVNYGYDIQNHLSIKINLGYNIITSFDNDEFSGNMFYVKSSVVWGFGTF